MLLLITLCLVDVDSSIIPDDDDTYDLGSDGQQWRDIYINGSAYIDGLAEDILVATDKKIQFRDSGLSINSSTDCCYYCRY